MSSNFIGGHELEQVRMENPVLGSVLRRIVGALNTTANNAGVSPTGQADAPPRIGAVNVKASGETVHVTLNDPNSITNQVEYFVEASTEPNFLAPHVFPLKSGRGMFLNLPSKTDSNAAQSWYFRGYSQYPGSQPSRPVYYGGNSPQAVTLTGSTQLTPLPSTGSGTASPLGGQGGWGRGKVPIRPAQGPKRRT